VRRRPSVYARHPLCARPPDYVLPSDWAVGFRVGVSLATKIAAGDPGTLAALRQIAAREVDDGPEQNLRNRMLRELREEDDDGLAGV
jgi:hypothetical protein